MQAIRTLKELEILVKEQETPTISVAYAHDDDTILAVNRAIEENIVKAILVGDNEIIKSKIKELGLKEDNFEIEHEPDEKKSGEKAVELIIDKKAHVLMKGLISTPYFLKAILKKDFNLIPQLLRFRLMINY